MADFTDISSTYTGWAMYLAPDDVLSLADFTIPEVTLTSPLGGTIQRQTPVVFTVSDDRGLTFVIVWVEYANGITEVVYGYNTSGVLEFKPNFRNSTVVGANPKTFTVRRTTGWQSSPRIFVQPVDQGGNTAL